MPADVSDEVLTLSEQINQAREAFVEAPDERARMGKISGVLWMCAATIGIVDVFLPGSQHASTPPVLAVGAAIFLSGLASVTRCSTPPSSSPSAGPGRWRSS